MSKNMGWVIGILVGLIVAAGTGGTIGGYQWAKKATEKKYMQVVERMQDDVLHTRLMVDSLQCIPPKIDTVIKYQLQVIERIDTVVITTAQILQYTRLIKADTDTIKSILKNENGN